jgi:hypothetical protein
VDLIVSAHDDAFLSQVIYKPDARLVRRRKLRRRRSLVVVEVVPGSSQQPAGSRNFVATTARSVDASCPRLA